jgi:hypothetical protein
VCARPHTHKYIYIYDKAIHQAVWSIVLNASAVLWPDLWRAHLNEKICPFYVAVVKISSTRVLFSIFLSSWIPPTISDVLQCAEAGRQSDRQQMFR